MRIITIDHSHLTYYLKLTRYVSLIIIILYVSLLAHNMSLSQTMVFLQLAVEIYIVKRRHELCSRNHSPSSSWRDTCSR